MDVIPVTRDPSPDRYAAVLIGSAVNGGQWLPDAVNYVHRHKNSWRQLPVAVFTVHIMNAGPDEQPRHKRMAYVDAVRPLLQPTAEAYFLGIGPDPAKDSWLARWWFRRFGGAGEGDCRDWEAIRTWAKTVLSNELEHSQHSARTVEV